MKKINRIMLFIVIIVMALTCLPKPSVHAAETPIKDRKRYNAAEHGLVTPVKNQGSEGLCWSFASNACLESYLLKNKYISHDFSESHMAHATSSAGNNPYGKDRSGISSGGWFDSAEDYWSRIPMSGPVKESKDPYTNVTNKDTIRAWRNTAAITPADFYISGTVSVEDDISRTAKIKKIKNLVAKYGAVYISYYPTNDGFKMSKDKGMDTRYYYYPTSLNGGHAVTIVGWDDNISKANFNNAPGNGGFIVKNSWGTGFGDNGYFYMSYHQAISNVHAVSDVIRRSSFNTQYEYDTYGYGGSGTTNYGKTNFYGNRFKANTSKNSNNELITHISTYSTMNDLRYKVFVSTTGKSKDLKEVKVKKFKTNSNGALIVEKGRVTFELAKPVLLKKGENYLVGIQVYDASNRYFTIPYESSYGKTAKNGSFAATSFSEAKTSSLSDMYYQTGSRNVCLKAFTSNLPQKIKINTSKVELSVDTNKKKTKQLNIVSGVKGFKMTSKAKSYINNVEWSSKDKNVAKISKTGKITAQNVKQSKETKIIAKHAALKATMTCKVSVKKTVRPKSVNITLSKKNIQKTDLIVGRKIDLNVAITPSYANTDKKVTWSTNNKEIATVNTNGVVTGKKKGKVTITATTANKKKSKCTVNVIKAIDVKKITAVGNKTAFSMLINQKRGLGVTYTPSNANINKDLKWSSSNSKVAVVDEKGVVQTKASGNVTITAVLKSDSKKKASFQLTVTDLRLNPDSVTFTTTKLEPKRLAVIITNSLYKPGKVSWYSDNSKIASVDQSGLVTPKTIGMAVITIKDQNGNTASAMVQVMKPVEDVNLDEDNVSLYTGQSVVLTAREKPNSNQKINDVVSWISSNPKVAIVDASGKVTAVGIGTAEIIAQTDSGSRSDGVYLRPKKDTCTIQVTDYTLKISKTQITYVLLNSDDIQLTTSTSLANYAPKVNWASSNSNVATVDTNGNVTVKSTGKAIITATTTDGTRKNVNCEVTVRQPKYTIKYHAEGGSGSMADTVVIYETDTPLRTNAFTRNGYVFKGWNALRTSDNKWRYRNTIDGSDAWFLKGQETEEYELAIYRDETVVYHTSKVDNDIVHFYAVWEKE